MLAETLKAEFFIAALPPAPVARALYDAFVPWHDHGPDAPAWDWKHPAHYHVTLGIAGEIRLDDIDLIERSMENALDVGPFTARMLRSGHFLKNANNRSNRHVLWAGFDNEGDHGFAAAARAVGEGLRDYRLNAAREKGEPHLTVARPASRLRHQVQHLVQSYGTLRRLPEWDVGEISLMQRLPRNWQVQNGLSHRFHEVARLSLHDGRMRDVEPVIVPASPSRQPALTPAWKTP